MIKRHTITKAIVHAMRDRHHSQTVVNSHMTKPRLKYLGLISCFFLSCGNAENNSLSNKEFERYNIDRISDALNSLDTLEIKKVSTSEGFTSVIKWSDSLRSKSFVKNVSKNLKNRDIFEITKHSDSIVVLSMGYSDEIVGATEGYLFLEKKKDIWKIKKYRGGK